MRPEGGGTDADGADNDDGDDGDGADADADDDDGDDGDVATQQLVVVATALPLPFAAFQHGADRARFVFRPPIALSFAPLRPAADRPWSQPRPRPCPSGLSLCSNHRLPSIAMAPNHQQRVGGRSPGRGHAEVGRPDREHRRRDGGAASSTWARSITWTIMGVDGRNHLGLHHMDYFISDHLGSHRIVVAAAGGPLPARERRLRPRTRGLAGAVRLAAIYGQYMDCPQARSWP